MFGGNLYSLVVAWLKILLPLVALAILSSVVFFARESEDERTIPMVTEVNVDDVPEPRMQAPEFMGVSSDGASVNVVAAAVTPVDENMQILDADRIEGRINTVEGRTIDSTAPEGRINTATNIVRFLGLVEVETSDQFRFVTEGLTTRMDRVEAKSAGPVTGTAPFGTLDAGALKIDHTPETGNVIHFTGGVKLVYSPTTQ